MQEVSFVRPLHISSQRDYFARMTPEKPECMRIAKQFGGEYWDGDRKYGYGGYRYDGRWKAVAKAMIKHYRLTSESSIFDIGYGKGYLLDEFGKQLWGEFGNYPMGPTYQKQLGAKKRGSLCGTEISHYAATQPRGGYALYDVSPCTAIRYGNGSFNFVYSINVFHNLGYIDLKKAIREMNRITEPEGEQYVCVESYRNEEELTNLQCWQLTCESYYSPDDWKEILHDNGYDGDIEFIYFP